MSKRKKRQKTKSVKQRNHDTKLKKETKQSVLALLLLSTTIILVLAGFGGAGKVGEEISRSLLWLFGWGYVFLPITLIGVSINLIAGKTKTNSYSMIFWGSIIFLFGTLGFTDVLHNGWGGVFGFIAGYPKLWFGNTAWGIISIALFIIGIVVSLDQPIYLKKEKSVRDLDTKIEPIVHEMTADIETSIKNEEKEEKKHDNKQKNTESKKTPNIEENIEFNIKNQAIDKKYTPPPYDLLKTINDKPKAGDLRANANIIKRTLENFGIPVDMGEINIGPKVTRYALRPAEGIKLSRITSLNQDLSLALAASPIRIEAPIQGKPYVGIEVPNRNSSIVRLGSLISYQEFRDSSHLTVPIGMDVTGKPIFANIEKMPHLLIAGATGSGKSITLHSILISLLYKNSPAYLNLVLIDPKRVELSSYAGIPHLTAPVVTDSKKSLGVFNWAISEMDRRYDTLLSAGVRDIQSYNKKNSEIMPFIVIVVDEIAELMHIYGHDIENAIVRLAQMARATGIHLILSTQRPSVEVITGLIKANITSRIALQVASQIDSRTIIDSAGAEKLLGGGDFLFMSSDLPKPKRIQGAYITEEEIKKVTSFIRENNKEYTNAFESISNNSEEEEDDNDDDKDSAVSLFDKFQNDDEDDSLLKEAVEIVKTTQRASASLLQRKLKIGYARAARILDTMEDKGMIGPPNGAKPREVYLGEEGGIE